MKKLVITGALGHIGSRYLHTIKPGDWDEVVMIDNLSTQRYTTLFNLPPSVSFRFFEDDICTCDLVKYFENAEVVLHLAAITNAAGSFDKQEKVEEVNFVGTQKIAEACVKTNSKLIFLSTTSVYGTQGVMVDEDCSQEELKPQSPYASSKLKAENYLQLLGKNKKLSFVICRFGTIYGVSKGMRFHTAINKFCWQASNNLPISVWKTALNQKRPYLDLTDAINAISFIIKNNIFDNKIYNVLTDNITVGEIVETIKKYIPTLKIELVESAIMNQLSYEVKCDKFKQLGFSFRGNMEMEIFETLHLLDSNLKK